MSCAGSPSTIISGKKRSKRYVICSYPAPVLNLLLFLRLPLWYSRKERFPRKGRSLMKVKSFRMDVFLFALSLGLLFNCTIVTGSIAAPYGSSVPTSPEAVCPLLNGQKIPPLTLKTLENKPFDLSAAITTKPTILIFYRGGW